MYHLQVGSMGAKLLLIYVICQTIITESLGGVTLPFSDSIGKVTPIKPKPLSPSTVSSLSWSASTVCESKNKLLSPATAGREFSSPLVFTSTSRALPVPKIDSLSIADVKLPDRLREKFVLPKLCCTSTSNTKAIPDIIGTPDVSLPYKNAFVPIPSKSSNSLPCTSSWDLSTSSFNKLLSVSSMKSLPVVPIESIKSICSDVSCLGTLPRSRTIDSPLALNIRKPLFSEQFSSNTFSSSLPSPLCYKSTYLPGVRTPSESLPLIMRPISYKGADNFNVPSQSGSQNGLSPTTVILKEKYIPCTTHFLNPIKTVDILEPINPIQLPKTSSNAPVSTKPEFLDHNIGAKYLWPSLEPNSGSPSVALLSSVDSKSQNNPFIKSMPNTLTHQKADFKLKPCTPPKIKPPGFKPPFINSPSSPFVSVSTLPPTLDVLTNKINCFDCLKNIDMIPIISACVETIERLNTTKDQIGDSRNVPRFEQINPFSSFAPKVASSQHPLFSRERVSKPIYSPPTIPCDPIPTVSSGTPYSPNTFSSSRISQTPSVSCINPSPSIAIAQTTSHIVSSINNIVSNIAQKILSSYQSYLGPAPQNTSQRPTSTTIQSVPCDNLELISIQTLPAVASPVNSQSLLPITISPIIDCVNPPTVSIPIADVPCQLPEYEMAASQLSPISLPTVAVLPPISSISYTSPQLCPSYLPSPILPSYPTISSPVYMEAPVYKLSSSKRDSDMEKLIEMMLLAEILNNDESFDWDDLDTLLAFLSLS